MSECHCGGEIKRICTMCGIDADLSLADLEGDVLPKGWYKVPPPKELFSAESFNGPLSPFFYTCSIICLHRLEQAFAKQIDDKSAEKASMTLSDKTLLKKMTTELKEEGLSDKDIVLFKDDCKIKKYWEETKKAWFSFHS